MAASEMSTRTGAEIVVKALANEGIGCIFGLAGNGTLLLLDTLAKSDEVRFIGARHEQGASFMAYGYARALNGAGACLSTAGPGATNLISGAAAAMKGSVPVVLLSGCAETRHLHRDRYQDFDLVKLFTPVTKWCHAVPSTAKLPEVLRAAFRIALSGPRGPVHLSLPSDVLAGTAECEDWTPSRYRPTNSIACRVEEARKVLDLLRGAEFPLIVAGRGVVSDNATARLVELAEILGLPVATHADCLDAFPSGHPLAIGPIGMFGWDCANKLLSRADLVVALGTHLDYISTTFNHKYLPQTARVVEINPASQQLGVVFPIELSIQSDARPFVESMLDLLSGSEVRPPSSVIADEKAAWRSRCEQMADASVSPLSPAYVVQMAGQLLDRGAIVTGDGGYYMQHVRNHFHSYSPDTYIDTENWGAIGASFPIALGARVARPDRQVVCFTGDGGFVMNMAELETAVREDIRVITVVLNDCGYESIRRVQRTSYGGRFTGSQFNNPDFAQFARGLGAFGERVTDPQDLAAAFARAIESQKPAVLDVHVAQ